MKTAEIGQLRDVLQRLKADVDALDAQQLNSVMALVDQCTDRDRLEPLLDTLRPKWRASAVSISRPASLGRILFLPVEKLLVSPAIWRPGHLTIPRSVLQPIIGQLPAMLGSRYARLQTKLGGRTMRDGETVAEVGSEIWPAVATALATCAKGQDPSLLPKNIPMSEAHFRKFCEAISELLRLGDSLAGLAAPDITSERFMDLGEAALTKAAAANSIDGIRRVGIICLVEGWQRQLAPAFISSILRRAGIGETEETLSPALANVIDTLGLSIRMELCAIETAPLTLSRRALMLADRVATALEDRILTRTPERARDLRALAEHCEAMFRAAIERCLASECHARLLALSHETQITNDAIEDVEHAARSVTEIVRAARILAPRASWPDAICQETAERLVKFGHPLPAGCPATRLGRLDVARIVEILAGPDAATPLATESD